MFLGVNFLFFNSFLDKIIIKTIYYFFSKPLRKTDLLSPIFYFKARQNTVPVFDLKKLLIIFLLLIQIR